jgi:cytochrome c
MKHLLRCMALLTATVAVPLSLPIMAAEPGDAARGKYVFFQCRVCHYAEKQAPHDNGPNLYNLFGRTAGTAAGFDYYSEAMKQSGMVWSPQYLDAWLANPTSFIPGTTMIFPQGVPDAQDRADLIAYLQQFQDQKLP